MRVIGISTLADNYAWLISPEEGGRSAVVDPSEAGPVASVLDEEGLELGWILATHHHADHVGGLMELSRLNENAEALCSKEDGRRITGVSRFVEDGERLLVAGTGVEALLVPGHTRGAVAWHLPRERLLFTGDTLFTGGCGRLFEGSPSQMYSSLMRIAGLPDETQIYCGHEYTVKNLRFALEIEACNHEVQERLGAEEARRDMNEPTVPSTLAVEKRTNPFLRAGEPELMSRLGTRDAVSTFAELRRRRDVY